MNYDVRQWPNTVYPGEVESECPEAKPVIDALLLNFRSQGPSPAGYRVKTLGAGKGGLWQINLRVKKRQIRCSYPVWPDDCDVPDSQERFTTRTSQSIRFSSEAKGRVREESNAGAQ